MQAFFKIVDIYEYVASPTIRRWAMDWCYEVLQKEDEFTKYITIGPVSKMINMLAVFIREGQDSKAFRECWGSCAAILPCAACW